MLGDLTQCGECQSGELQKDPKEEFLGLGCLKIITNGDDLNDDSDEEHIALMLQTIWHLGLDEFEDVSYVLVDIVVFHNIPDHCISYHISYLFPS